MITIQAQDNLRRFLLAELGAGSHWTGYLADSALATAVAVMALHAADADAHHAAVCAGLEWLATNVNGDGGWGDTPENKSNLSTTLLCRAAFNAALPGNATPQYDGVITAADVWLAARIPGAPAPEAVARAVLEHYGNDRTFSAPILATCALAGLLGPAPEAWRLVPQLPFEVAVLPHQLFKWARLPVVSYALPALIAVGLVRHRCGPRPGRRWHPRSFLAPRLLRLLDRIQPASGGFLEAIPLTSFTALFLLGAGFGDAPVVTRAIRFLRSAQRSNGGWAIDSNLSTWVTTLAIKALAVDRAGLASLSAEQVETMREWLLRQQTPGRHPYSHAARGGWAWTDLSGGVPDADDTAGALVALANLRQVEAAAEMPTALSLQYARAAENGIRWLEGLQNRDGGIPTFCRGWGRLPFDRSCPDITAHFLQACHAWSACLSPGMARRVGRAQRRALAYLVREQQADGSWFPLWFGNENEANHRNPVYGTAQVVRALGNQVMASVDGSGRGGLSLAVASAWQQGRLWLEHAQNSDGGWGGAPGLSSSMEETAVALTALASGQRQLSPALAAGGQWLAAAVMEERLAPAPIGLYFASLWYSERLYPALFGLEALGNIASLRSAFPVGIA